MGALRRLDGSVTDLAATRATFQRWLHLPDTGALDAVLATVAANRIKGDPIWLLLVGPPGGGKSEILERRHPLEDAHPAGTLTEAALLSGTPNKERAEAAKGGLLRAIGDFGIIVAKDFGSVLSMNRDARAQLLAALREIYDGAWTRHVGTDGGKTLAWAARSASSAAAPRRSTVTTHSWVRWVNASSSTGYPTSTPTYRPGRRLATPAASGRCGTNSPPPSPPSSTSTATEPRERNDDETDTADRARHTRRPRPLRRRTRRLHP